MTFSNASAVMIFDGRRSSHTISTIACPTRSVDRAILVRRRNRRGRPAATCRALSASEFIVDAVPIVLQCPATGADEAMSSMNSSSLISPCSEQLARLPDDRP
jgi:hypothetical protein